MAETEKTGGQLLVACLLEQGVTAAFGVPGESYLSVLDALIDAPEIRLVNNRHEGAAAFMAAAWGQLTGRPGICFVTRGPGATNASIGIHTARQNSTPMILFIGQIDSNQRDREAFQEIDYRAFFGPISKWVVEIETADRIPEIITRAFSVAMSRRPGPVVISLPENVLAAVSCAVPRSQVIAPEPAPSEESLSALFEQLAYAKRPLTIVGGTGWSQQGRRDFRQFVELNGLPVLNAFRFQDILDNNSNSYCGDAGLGKLPNVQKLIDEADVLIGFNIRWGEITTDSYSRPDPLDESRPIIHSHASDTELGKIFRADVPIHAGPNSLAAVLKDKKLGNWSDWSTMARTEFETYRTPPAQPGPVDMGKVMEHLQSILPDDAILTNGAGNFAIWPSKYFMFGEKHRLLAPQSGAMGYGLAAAIAAKLALPERTIVCIAGDGDFLMNCQELSSARQIGACPIVLIVNNGSYGTIRMHQEMNFPGRVIFTDIANPDFVALCKSFGFHAETVRKTAEFPIAFERALQSKHGAVIELIVDIESITPRATLSQIRMAALSKVKN